MYNNISSETLRNIAGLCSNAIWLTFGLFWCFNVSGVNNQSDTDILRAYRYPGPAAGARALNRGSAEIIEL